MGLYHLRKWFFDVTAGTGDYLILFVSLLKAGGKYFATLQVHGSGRNHGRKFQPVHSCLVSLHLKEFDGSRMIFREGGIIFENGECRIRLNAEKCSIDLVFSGVIIDWPGTPALLNGRKDHLLEWVPLILNGGVTGSIAASGVVTTYHQARGYCDEIQTVALPWKLPFFQLFWGRIQHEGCNITYSIMPGTGSSRGISKIYFDDGAALHVLNDLNIEITQWRQSQEMNLSFADEYCISAQNAELSISIRVRAHEEMILNDFMDIREEYGRLAELLIRRISRNPRGIKFRAVADVRIQSAGSVMSFGDIEFVDEYVEFL